MDSYRRQQIEARAQALLNEAGVHSLPIEPQKIAEYLDIAVHAKPETASGASGWLVRQGNDFAIVYATHIPSVGFQNFSIAHELGHYWLEGHPEHVFRSGNEHASRSSFSSTDPIEREADYFASCLMMPKSMCKDLIRKNSDGMAAVKSLATACNSSMVAAALRYAEIGHLAAGVLQCQKGRVEFCAIHPLQAHVGWARPLAQNMKVPLDSATWRLAQDADAVLSGGEDSDSGEASDWFSAAKGGVHLIEEVIGLGRFGRTLTLLTLEEADDDEDD